MDSLVHGFAAAGAVWTAAGSIWFACWVRNQFVAHAETKAALAHDAERSKEQEIEDRVLAVVKDLMERKALPAPTPEAE